MPCLETWNSDQLTVHWFGQVRDVEIAELARSVAQAPDYRQVRNVLSDFSECVGIEAGAAADAAPPSGRGDVVARDRGPAPGSRAIRAAIVAARSNATDLARWFAGAEGAAFTVRVFADAGDARAWLAHR